MEDIHEYELSRLTNYGIKKWYEVFSERQLLVMVTLLKYIKELSSELRILNSFPPPPLFV